MNFKKGSYFTFAFLAICIGIYPLIFLLTNLHHRFLDGKEAEVVADLIWRISFYLHITFGGIALLVGWSQFNKTLRSKNIQIHRVIGKVYVFSALLSALPGIYIGYFSMGGIIASTGFISLGLIWFYTTFQAYIEIKAKNILEHERMMIYSYAACFAAVTLRLWLPLFRILFNDFESAYRVVAWWCWIPNLVVAYFIISKRHKIIGSEL